MEQKVKAAGFRLSESYSFNCVTTVYIPFCANETTQNKTHAHASHLVISLSLAWLLSPCPTTSSSPLPYHKHFLHTIPEDSDSPGSLLFLGLPLSQHSAYAQVYVVLWRIFQLHQCSSWSKLFLLYQPRFSDGCYCKLANETNLTVSSEEPSLIYPSL